MDAAARIDALEEKFQRDIAALRSRVLKHEVRPAMQLRWTDDGKNVSVYDYIQAQRPTWNRLRVRRETGATLSSATFRVFSMHVKGGTKPTVCADEKTANLIYQSMLNREGNKLLSSSLEKEPEAVNETQTHSMLCSCLLCA